ncbi:MAG TPA: DUF6624 domain-containing protein [Gemmatimonadales bacterium]|nr:DUF6624 domain-containing protein [Gemmatimonadales bacterium]
MTGRCSAATIHAWPRCTCATRRSLRPSSPRWAGPGVHLAGEDGAEAAWRVLQHAIGSPALQRECLPLLEAAAARGDVPASYPALLADRIAFCERRPQRYGTQFDWDRDGHMSVWPIADPETVDQRRAVVGLPPLADAERQIREQAAREGEVRPADYEQRQREIDHWAGRVGWLATSGSEGMHETGSDVGDSGRHGRVR